MSSDRPNPDELLARVQAEEARAHRGRLRIFFGYAAGVGKTFAMLEAAQRERREGTEVVVGYVEPHGRPETEALLAGLEALPVLRLPYRDIELREFDLDAALKRRPALLLVDELAHTNAEGCRHAKRWQDVEELLESGIDVWTTLNVQHIESLNDIIAQISGVTVRETIPDAVFERADELELIDITPEELVERLEAGKVYLPAQAERAIRQFFQKSNLVALRELSLRQAAGRLQLDVDFARREAAATRPWATTERLLVCVGPSPTTPRVIRTAKRMATALGGEWLAVCVELQGEQRAAPAVQEQVARHLRLAERLGAETVTISGQHVAEAILDYARRRNVTKIVVGKTAERRWRRLFKGSVVDQLLEHSGDIDVYVIHGEREAGAATRRQQRPAAFDTTGYMAAAIVVVLCTLIGWGLSALRLSETNLVMVYLAGVAVIAARCGRGPAAAAALAGVLAFDFFFVPPYLTFAVSDGEYILTFAVMLVIGLTIATLTFRMREQAAVAREREHRAAALYRLTRQLAAISGIEFLVGVAGRQVSEMFGGEAAIYLRDDSAPLQPRYGERTSIATHAVNSVVAEWVADHERLAGAGSDTLPNANAVFVPLVGSQRTIGALAVKVDDIPRLHQPPERQLLEACASQIALAIERDQLALEAHQAQLQIEAEQLRSSLLSSVSHDLRTPLAAIAGAASSLLEARAPRDDETRRELLDTIVEESHRLSRLVDNLLDMSRLESGAAPLQPQWHVLEELVGSALQRMRRPLARHHVHVDILPNLPLVSVDGPLLEQVLVNLLENAARYTPPGSRIDVTAGTEPREVVIRVADNGPGLPAGTEQRVFDKFFRGVTGPADGQRGTGLGLAICQAIVSAHGGRITAENRPSGGAEFTVRLPLSADAPQVPAEDAAAIAAVL
jgi:two-component system sensor histidine kinase KdpD